MTNLRLVGIPDESVLRTTLMYWAEQEADYEETSEDNFGGVTYLCRRDDMPAKIEAGSRGLAYRIESIELMTRTTGQILELVNDVPKDLKKAYNALTGELIIRRPLNPRELEKIGKLRLTG